MNRRKFFALFAAIPFVGRMVAKQKSKFVWPPTPTEPTMYVLPSDLAEAVWRNSGYIKVVAEPSITKRGEWYIQTPYYDIGGLGKLPKARYEGNGL